MINTTTATGSWTYPEVTGDRPPPRSNHASAVIGTRFYIFGGSVGDNVNRYETVNDFYYCDVGTARTHTAHATAHAPPHTHTPVVSS